MSVTDGSLTTDGAAQTVRIVNSTTTPASVSIVQGGQTVNVAVPGPNLGAGLVTTTGTLVSSQTLTAQTAVAAGTVADFGSAKANISCVFTTTAGISAGAVALEVSHDNVNFFRTGTPATLTASAVSNIAISGNAFRYARGAITTTVTGGTVSATLMAS
jgi:hypothetical protein